MTGKNPKVRLAEERLPSCDLVGVEVGEEDLQRDSLGESEYELFEEDLREGVCGEGVLASQSVVLGLS